MASGWKVSNQCSTSPRLKASLTSRNRSTFSSDIAHAVSPAVGEGASAELPSQKTADWVGVHKPDAPSGGRLP